MIIFIINHLIMVGISYLAMNSSADFFASSMHNWDFIKLIPVMAFQMTKPQKRI